MFTQTRAGRSDLPLLCLIQASSGPGALQLQAAVASHFLANTDTRQWEGAVNNHLPSSMQFPSPLQLGYKSHCMGLSFNSREYITWAIQTLLVRSEETLFSLENFLSCTSCSMYPLFLATLLTLKILDQVPPSTYTFTQHVRTLGSTAAVGAKE